MKTEKGKFFGGWFAVRSAPSHTTPDSCVNKTGLLLAGAPICQVRFFSSSNNHYLILVPSSTNYPASSKVNPFPSF